MGEWIDCGKDFIKADVIRWTEPVYDGPFGRNGRKLSRGKAVRVGERQVTAEVVSEADEKGLVLLLVRACDVVSVRDDVPAAPQVLKPTSEIGRKASTLTKGRVERLAWSDESARYAVVASQSNMAESCGVQGKMDRENIYQMFTRLGGSGFFVKRNSWSHPKAVARIVSIGGLTIGELPGRPPYHNQGGKLGSPKVIAEISYRGEPPQTQELSCPGTYAYTNIARPDWWPKTGTDRE